MKEEIEKNKHQINPEVKGPLPESGHGVDAEGGVDDLIKRIKDLFEGRKDIGSPKEIRGLAPAGLMGPIETTPVQPPYIYDYPFYPAIGTTASGSLGAISSSLPDELGITRQAMRLNNWGVEAYKTGELQEAENYWREAIILKPDLAEVYFNLGNNYLIRQKNDEAISLYTRAIRLRQDFVEAYYNIGNAYLAKGDFVKAEENYRSAIQLKSDFAEAYHNLGIALINRQANAQGEEAFRKEEETFRKELNYRPGDPESHFFLGRFLWRQDRFPEAVEEFRKALALRPDYLEAYTSLGYCLDEWRKPKEAREIFIDALPYVTDPIEREYIIARLQKDEDVRENPLFLAPFPGGKLLPSLFMSMDRDGVSFRIIHKGNLGVGRKKDERGQPQQIDEQFVPLEANICGKLAKWLDDHNQRKEARIYWKKQNAIEKDPQKIMLIKTRLDSPD